MPFGCLGRGSTKAVVVLQEEQFAMVDAQDPYRFSPRRRRQSQQVPQVQSPPRKACTMTTHPATFLRRRKQSRPCTTTKVPPVSPYNPYAAAAMSGWTIEVPDQSSATELSFDDSSIVSGLTLETALMKMSPPRVAEPCSSSSSAPRDSALALSPIARSTSPTQSEPTRARTAMVSPHCSFLARGKIPALSSTSSTSSSSAATPNGETVDRISPRQTTTTTPLLESPKNSPGIAPKQVSVLATGSWMDEDAMVPNGSHWVDVSLVV